MPVVHTNPKSNGVSDPNCFADANGVSNANSVADPSPDGDAPANADACADRKPNSNPAMCVSDDNTEPGLRKRIGLMDCGQ
jgi:hypothetical protein